MFTKSSMNYRLDPEREHGLTEFTHTSDILRQVNSAHRSIKRIKSALGVAQSNTTTLLDDFAYWMMLLHNKAQFINQENRTKAIIGGQKWRLIEKNPIINLSFKFIYRFCHVP